MSSCCLNYTLTRVHFFPSPHNGEPQNFGGTSGAAPLVTGSLAGFEWLSGYHPTAKESKILLENTAIPTAHIHERPRRNGAGLLNSYKLGRLGKLLKQKCMDKPPDCFQKEIRKEENYHFPKPVGLNEDLSKVFPGCSKRAEVRGRVSGGKCGEKERVFKSLRRAVLLEPESEDLWKVLSCIYKEAGFSVNGRFLDKIAFSGSREKVTKMLSSFTKSKNVGKRKKKMAVRLARNIGGKEGVSLLQAFSKERMQGLEKVLPTQREIWVVKGE